MNISIDKKIEGEVQSFDQAFALIINVLDRRFGLEGRLWVSEGGRDIKQDHATFRGIGAVVLKKTDKDAYSLAQISEILDVKGAAVGIFVRLHADEFYRAGLEPGVYYGLRLKMRNRRAEHDLGSLAKELEAKLRNIWPEAQVAPNYITEPVI